MAVDDGEPEKTYSNPKIPISPPKSKRKRVVDEALCVLCKGACDGDGGCHFAEGLPVQSKHLAINPNPDTPTNNHN
jgi:hypothetical protein